MTHHTLIVARMEPGAAPEVAGIFAASDRHGELPGLIGVRRRTLFQYNGLYLHLVEADTPPGPEVAQHRDHPEFRDISEQLAPHVLPYDPATWREPKDAMAREFYRWERNG